MDPGSISVVLPARNEAASLGGVLARIRAVLPDAELVVVDDGSTDATVSVAREQGAVVVSHPMGLGNGAAVKSGARAARGDVLVFLDADGQHPPELIPELLAKLETGYDMAVGARSRAGQASIGRAWANGLYNVFATWLTGQRILDLTSGFRAVRAAKFRRFLSLLPNGFSYPTTITMAFLRSGYPVAFVPAEVAQRQGRSHLSPLRDGVRFLLIIFKVATLYAPLKLFFPASISLAGLGLLHYLRTYLLEGRFTNMSALLMSTGVVVFFVGLLSEQICTLTYATIAEPERNGSREP